LGLDQLGHVEEMAQQNPQAIVVALATRFFRFQFAQGGFALGELGPEFARVMAALLSSFEFPHLIA